MDFQSAKTIAIAAGRTLLPYCDKLNIAGSIRRKKAEVKDIELVCLPKTSLQPSADLFAPPQPLIIPEFRQAVASLGAVIKGQPTGKYMQIELPQGIKLDLFMPPPP